MSTPGSWSAKINTNSSSDHHGSDWPGGAASSKDGKASLYHTEGGRGGDEGDGSVRMVKTARVSNRQLVLDQLTKDRNRVLDDWADAGTLGLTPDEVAINKFQRKHLKFLFGETGFNPPVPARNPVSVNMHNPRFSAALWAVNTEAYRRKGSVSRYHRVETRSKRRGPSASLKTSTTIRRPTIFFVHPIEAHHSLDCAFV